MKAPIWRFTKSVPRHNGIDCTRARKTAVPWAGKMQHVCANFVAQVERIGETGLQVHEAMTGTKGPGKHARIKLNIFVRQEWSGQIRLGGHADMGAVGNISRRSADVFHRHLRRLAVDWLVVERQ